AGLTVAPSRGVFVYSPALLIAFVGIAAVRRSASNERALLVAGALAVVAAIAFYAIRHDWRGGWAYGPRYLCETLPIMCLLFAIGYESLALSGRRLAIALVGVSVFVQLIGIAGYGAHNPWHRRHDLNDHGWSLFSIHDTEIEAHARQTVRVIGRL